MSGLPLLAPDSRERLVAIDSLRVDFTTEAAIREVCREFIAKTYEANIRRGLRGKHAVPTRFMLDRRKFESPADAARAIVIADEEMVRFADRKGIILSRAEPTNGKGR